MSIDTNSVDDNKNSITEVYPRGVQFNAGRKQYRVRLAVARNQVHCTHHKQYTDAIQSWLSMLAERILLARNPPVNTPAPPKEKQPRIAVLSSSITAMTQTKKRSPRCTTKETP